jgi:hypothetical protein
LSLELNNVEGMFGLAFFLWSLKKASFSICHISRMTAPLPGFLFSALSKTFLSPSWPSLDESIQSISLTSSLFCCSLTATGSIDHPLSRSAKVFPFSSRIVLSRFLGFWAQDGQSHHGGGLLSL